MDLKANTKANPNPNIFRKIFFLMSKKKMNIRKGSGSLFATLYFFAYFI